MTKTLFLNPELLPNEESRQMLALMRTATDKMPVEIAYKTLLPSIKASNPTNFKDVIRLEGGDAVGGLAAKIMAFLSQEKAQDALTTIQTQIQAVETKLDSKAELKVGIFDERLDGKWVSNEAGDYTHRQLRIPVEMLGPVTELVAQAKELEKTRWQKFVELLRGEKIVADDKEPKGGKIKVVGGKLSWVVPERKARGPKDPNAPARTRASGAGVTYTFGIKEGLTGLVAGEPEGAQVIGTGIASRTKLANAMAAYTIKNGLKGFTVKDQTQPNLNWPTVYAVKAKKAGFWWTEVKAPEAAPTNGDSAK